MRIHSFICHSSRGSILVQDSIARFYTSIPTILVADPSYALKGLWCRSSLYSDEIDH